LTISSDTAAIERLYRDVFPDEDLVPLVRELLGRTDVFSLAAESDDRIVGHVASTRCAIVGCSSRVALLGPLAVLSAARRRGVGRGLVGDCARHARQEGMVRLFVLGDPAYYARLGFVTEADIEPPYRLPMEWRSAWQSLRLVSDEVDVRAGRLSVPAPWQRPELWSP
jgi:putative acetyltransferase